MGQQGAIRVIRRKGKEKGGRREWAGMWHAGRARCWADGEIWAERLDKVAGLKIKRERERVKRPGWAGFEGRREEEGGFGTFFLFF
jgi:hypothetical protein